MDINSPLGNFVEVLCKVRESALRYQGKLSKSEASTRITLIDPILKALGWDIANPTMIEVEKTLPPQARADYALFNQENKIQVVIEAKALGVNLGDKAFVLNLVMYAYSAGISDIFLTDGVLWEHYHDFTPGKVISSRTLDLTKDNLLECANYLVNEIDAAKFWQGASSPENTGNELVSKQILDLRSEISDLKQLIATIQQPVLPITITPQPTVIHNQDDKFVELASLPADLTGKTPPTCLRLPDGTTKEISKWRDILDLCVRFVLEHNPSIPIPFPDAAGKKVKLLDTNPLPEGLAQHKVTYQGKDLFIYENYDSKHCVVNAIYILKLLDQRFQKSQAAVLF